MGMNAMAQTVQPRSNYKYQVEGYDDEDTLSMARGAISMLKRWNESINRYDAQATAACFEIAAFYFTDCFDRSGIASSLQGTFKRYPQYYQYVDNVKVSIVNSCTIEVSFSKHVVTAPDVAAKTYPAYLLMNWMDEATIKKESDKVTDANLEKRSHDYVSVSNTMPMSAIFNAQNVNKYIKTGYWDLVGFEGDAKEGPLAKAMIAATGCARSDMFGPLHRNYKGKAGTYYVGGHAAAGESGWYVIYVYDSKTGKLTAINGEE